MKLERIDSKSMLERDWLTDSARPKQKVLEIEE